MPSNRIGRINEEIQRELSQQIRRLKDPRVSQVGMVSVTHVDTTSDLRYAKIYISVLGLIQNADINLGIPPATCAMPRFISAFWIRDRPCACAIPRNCNLRETTPSSTALIFWKCCGIPTWSSPPTRPMKTSAWRTSHEHPHGRTGLPLASGA